MVAKSIDELLEEEERYAEQARAEKARREWEEEKLLRKAQKYYGKDGYKMYSENGKKSGMDWDSLKFRL